MFPFICSVKPWYRLRLLSRPASGHEVFISGLPPSRRPSVAQGLAGQASPREASAKAPSSSASRDSLDAAVGEALRSRVGSSAESQDDRTKASLSGAERKDSLEQGRSGSDSLGPSREASFVGRQGSVGGRSRASSASLADSLSANSPPPPRPIPAASRGKRRPPSAPKGRLRVETDTKETRQQRRSKPPVQPASAPPPAGMSVAQASRLSAAKPQQPKVSPRASALISQGAGLASGPSVAATSNVSSSQGQNFPKSQVSSSGYGKPVAAVSPKRKAVPAAGPMRIGGGGGGGGGGSPSKRISTDPSSQAASSQPMQASTSRSRSSSPSKAIGRPTTESVLLVEDGKLVEVSYDQSQREEDSSPARRAGGQSSRGQSSSPAKAKQPSPKKRRGLFEPSAEMLAHFPAGAQGASSSSAFATVKQPAEGGSRGFGRVDRMARENDQEYPPRSELPRAPVPPQTASSVFNVVPGPGQPQSALRGDPGRPGAHFNVVPDPNVGGPPLPQSHYPTRPVFQVVAPEAAVVLRPGDGPGQMMAEAGGVFTAYPAYPRPFPQAWQTPPPPFPPPLRPPGHQPQLPPSPARLAGPPPAPLAQSQLGQLPQALPQPQLPPHPHDLSHPHPHAQSQLPLQSHPPPPPSQAPRGSPVAVQGQLEESPSRRPPAAPSPPSHSELSERRGGHQERAERHREAFERAFGPGCSSHQPLPAPLGGGFGGGGGGFGGGGGGGTSGKSTATVKPMERPIQPKHAAGLMAQPFADKTSEGRSGWLPVSRTLIPFGLPRGRRGSRAFVIRSGGVVSRAASAPLVFVSVTPGPTPPASRAGHHPALAPSTSQGPAEQGPPRPLPDPSSSAGASEAAGTSEEAPPRTYFPSKEEEAFSASEKSAFTAVVMPVRRDDAPASGTAGGKVLIRGGTVVNDDNMFCADVLVEDGVIKAVGANLTAPAGVRTVEAAGKYVIPGGIDTNVHFALPLMGATSVDGWDTGTAAAVAGGTTMVVGLAVPKPGESLTAAYERWRAAADPAALCDFGLALAVPAFNAKVAEEMAALVKEKGVNAFKFFMAYKDQLQLSDGDLLAALGHCKRIGALARVHAENGDLVAAKEEEMLGLGVTGPEGHVQARPEEAEAEAVNRACVLAKTANAPLLIDAITSKSAADTLVQHRKLGTQVWGECLAAAIGTDGSHYFNKCWRHAAAHVTAPPLRLDPGTAGALVAGLASGQLAMVASDHATFTGEQKALGKEDFTAIPHGLNGVEERLGVAWERGVEAGQLDPMRFVAVTSANAAKLLNLYPKKGRIAVGMDADLCVWNPTAKITVSAKTQQSKCDFNVFEGLTLHGAAEVTVAGGRVVWEKGALVGGSGGGRFVALPSHSPHLFALCRQRDNVCLPQKVERAAFEGKVAKAETESLIKPKAASQTGAPLPAGAGAGAAGRAGRPSGQRNQFQSTLDFGGPEEGKRVLSTRVAQPPGGASRPLWD